MGKRAISNKNRYPSIAFLLNTVSLAAVIVFAFALFLQDIFHKDITNVLGVISSEEQQKEWIVSNKISSVEKYLETIPNPINKISMAGTFDTDQVKIDSVESLKDVWKVYDLGYAYKVTSDNKYSDKAKEFLFAWTDIYIPSGNPIDESHLVPLFQGYAWVRDSFTLAEKAKIDGWLKDIATKEINTTYSDNRGINNWNSHRISLIGIIGLVIGDTEIANFGVEEFKKHLENNLNPDGTTFDFIERDAIHYHLYDLYPLIVFSKEASLRGTDIFNYTTSNGASLKKSVNFAIPYIAGEKTHAEYVNSNVTWDSHLKKGQLFKPSSSLEFLEVYYFFDSSVLPLIQKIRNNYTEYPSFEVFLNIVQREEAVKYL